jgi:glycosyltransferase involved in cell wall biosynthesis
MEHCIIIPAYNAEATIRGVVTEALMHGLPVVVVDDGSVDGTVAAISDLSVNLVQLQQNSGKGAALKAGFAWCLNHGFEGAVTIDADAQHDPSAIPALIDAAEAGNYDLLIASRSTQFSHMAGLRHVWNRFGVWCISKRTGFDITDSQSGFRYYSSLMLCDLEFRANGYHMEMEALLKAWRNGFRIGSLPVPARVADGRATSHFRPVRDTWKICMTFLKYM